MLTTPKVDLVPTKTVKDDNIDRSHDVKGFLMYEREDGKSLSLPITLRPKVSSTGNDILYFWGTDKIDDPESGRRYRVIGGNVFADVPNKAKAEATLSGKAAAGQAPEEKKEETPAEYKKRVMEGKL